MAEEDSLGFKEHLELSDLLLGIKEGKFFQGRLMVSRIDIK